MRVQSVTQEHPVCPPEKGPQGAVGCVTRERGGTSWWKIVPNWIIVISMAHDVVMLFDEAGYEF